MKTVFFGTPRFAAEILDFLFENKVDLQAVVTQPDRPQGRSSKEIASPVKSLVLKKSSNTILFQPEKAKEDHFLKELEALHPDLFVVVAYGQILSQKLLDIPRLGAINVHASLLPLYRGAAPMQRALMDGVKETGVSIQKMVLKMDAGDVIGASKIPVSDEMDLFELENALIALTKPLLLSVIEKYKIAPPKGNPQDERLVSFAPKLNPEDLKIDWSKKNFQVHNLIRAVSPKPGAWAWTASKGEQRRIKILKSKISSEEGTPGSLLPGFRVACGSGSIQLVEVQLEGKKVLLAEDWLRGQAFKPFFS